tara:strand:- start:1930 stop:5460 length:3531 start_codon:yes stop_codon:yes gene_type:complete
MKIRLVAYRKATSASTVDTTYELDLQEAPNISLNFQFSDIKEPEQRKGSFSQTFKLPFTDANNEFFQNWYNVNLAKLIFNTRSSFQAVLFVGTVSQFEGNLQLKAVYQKAQYYEVVLMSNEATLFSTIGEKRLKDIFREDNGSYSAELNHTFSYLQFKRSWTGSSSLFVNSAGDSLRDSSTDPVSGGNINVQKVMYPMSITKGDFFYDPSDVEGQSTEQRRYLRLNPSTISGLSYEEAAAVSVPISQFRPAIQLKTLFKLILARAGFSYTSNFIDSEYFGRIFTTTGNHLEEQEIPTTNLTSAPTGYMYVGNTNEWGVINISSSQTNIEQTGPDRVLEANTSSPIGTYTVPQDNDSIFTSGSGQYYQKLDNTMNQINFAFMPRTTSNIVGTSYGGFMNFEIRIIPYDLVSGPDYNTTFPNAITTVMGEPSTTVMYIEGAIDISNVPYGEHFQIIVRPKNYKTTSSGQTLTLGNWTGYELFGQPLYSVAGINISAMQLYSRIEMNWVGNSSELIDQTIDIPACIDPEITQRAFIKDLVQRFNLVIISNPEDKTNLIIEPYKDFIEAGTLKYWTDKLDTSKEIIVKDTTELQKKVITFSDKEDVDLLNKEIKLEHPDLNVFGNLSITETGNEFATGELKNESIFSPYINAQVYTNASIQTGTQLINLAVQYEHSYENNEGIYTNPIKKTKPKLFYYSGVVTTLLNPDGNTPSVYLHHTTISSGVPSLNANSFTALPNCTPFDISANTTSSLTSTTKSLYWNATPPIVGGLSVFNYTNNFGNWFGGTLYGAYWRDYLNDIYSDDARIMEAYLNLNEVDIFQFQFNDEIFIKDCYWRILKIQNYQVGAKASTKITFIKSLNSLSNNLNCRYVPGFLNNNNLYGNYFMWCLDTDPGCTPEITGDMTGIYTQPECCVGMGGTVEWNDVSQASNNLYPCLANASSLPLFLKSIYSGINIMEKIGLKGLFYNKLGGNKPLQLGNDYNKYSQPLLPFESNDINIKHQTSQRNVPQLRGESHKLVLSGFTEGNVRGYAYFEGNKYKNPIHLPNNSTTILRVKGTSVVIGGTSSSYPVGTTEGFSYYTVFKNIDGTVTQLGAAGGVLEFSLKESVATSTLYINTGTNNVLQFGLDDSQTDTKKIWSLAVNLDINLVDNIVNPYNENWALFQNFRIIELENGNSLIWN